MKVFDWMIKILLYVIGGLILFAFLSDMIGLLGNVAVAVTSSITSFLAFLATLAVFFYFKKDAVYNVFTGLKQKLSK